MKAFTTIKIGYTTGIYGCSGEYFTAVIIDGNKNRGLTFYGLYGTEERVSRLLKEKGYKEFYTPSNYGQLKRTDINKHLVKSEREVIDYIKSKEFKQSFRTT